MATFRLALVVILVQQYLYTAVVLDVDGEKARFNVKNRRTRKNSGAAVVLRQRAWSIYVQQWFFPGSWYVVT